MKIKKLQSPSFFSIPAVSEEFQRWNYRNVTLKVSEHTKHSNITSRTPKDHVGLTIVVLIAYLYKANHPMIYLTPWLVCQLLFLLNRYLIEETISQKSTFLHSVHHFELNLELIFNLSVHCSVLEIPMKRYPLLMETSMVCHMSQLINYSYLIITAAAVCSANILSTKLSLCVPCFEQCSQTSDTKKLWLHQVSPSAWGENHFFCAPPRVINQKKDY